LVERCPVLSRDGHRAEQFGDIIQLERQAQPAAVRLSTVLRQGHSQVRSQLTAEINYDGGHLVFLHG